MKVDKTTFDRCRYCKLPFSDEILKKIKDNKEDIICQHCGDIVIRIQDNYNFIKPEANEGKSNYNILPATLQTDIIDNPEALLYPNGRIFYDKDFSLIFKSNLIIVISRLIYFHIRRLESIGQLRSTENEISENIINKLHMCINPVQRMRIKTEFLNGLRLITVKELDNDLKKLQGKIQLNKDYQEDFIIYCRWLIRRVYTLVAEKFESLILSNFERSIIKDLNEFELTEYYQLNLNSNKKFNQLDEPRNLVSQYFKKIGNCYVNQKLTKIRHNYIIKDNHTLICLDCKKILINNKFSESAIVMNSKELKRLEDSKSFGDITIYRVYYARTLVNGEKEWLPFPGIGYGGQTVENARKRIYSGHIKNAFDTKKKHSYFENSIKRNFIVKEMARKFIRIKILQIIRFQGDINVIWNIDDPNLKKKEIEEAINSTQKLADNAEKFWIGYYKTQYKEFGRNIEEGGKENKMVLIDPTRLDESLRKNMHMRRSRSPFQNVRKELNTTRAVLVNNILYYYGKSLKDITHKMILQETKNLFELGYVAKDIATKLRLEGEIENASKTISDWIRNEIYNERFPEKPNYRRIRDIILSEIIEQKVKEGYTTLKSLLTILPGFEVPGETIREKSWELKRFIINNLGGITKLAKKYHSKPEKDYLTDAINIIKEFYRTKKKISAVKLAFELGFCQDFDYTEDNLRKNAASRYIPKHTGKTLKELIEIALKS